MTDPTPTIPTFPKASTVEQVRDYLEWHVQNGRGRHVLEVRAQYIVMPPVGDTHDDEDQRVFLRGYY